MPIELDTGHILLGCGSSSRDEVIRAIGSVMLQFEEVTPRYVEGMIEKEQQYSTWVTEGVALPHGTSAVKGEVLRSSVVVAQIPQGVDWGGKVVRLAIGLAGKGDEQHLKLLSALAEVLQDSDAVSALSSAKDKNEMVRLLAGGEGKAK
jgi:mannitol/fructose-specific phosphotransferase system IIA component